MLCSVAQQWLLLAPQQVFALIDNDLPTLVRVVVTDGTTFVMDRNLKDALARLSARERTPPRPPELAGIALP